MKFILSSRFERFAIDYCRKCGHDPIRVIFYKETAISVRNNPRRPRGEDLNRKLALGPNDPKIAVWLLPNRNAGERIAQHKIPHGTHENHWRELWRKYVSWTTFCQRSQRKTGLPINTNGGYNTVDFLLWEYSQDIQTGRPTFRSPVSHPALNDATSSFTSWGTDNLSGHTTRQAHERNSTDRSRENFSCVYRIKRKMVLHFETALTMYIRVGIRC